MTSLKQNKIETNNTIIANDADVSEVILDNENTISAEEIIEKAKSTITEIKKPANDNFPIIPTDPDELVKFIADNQAAIDANNIKMESSPVSGKGYQNLLLTTKRHAKILLFAELQLGYELRKIETRRGQRTDLKNPDDNLPMTKAEVIENDFGLKPSQAKQIARLTEEGVLAAIKYADDNNAIPTRTMALSFIKKQEAQEKNRNPDEYNTIYETEHIPHGIYKDDIKYTDLFCCAGTCEAYLGDHGFVATVANEYVEKRANLYKHLHPTSNVIIGDINKKVDEIIKLHNENGCEFLIASSVCKPFSKAGKQNHDSKEVDLFIPMLEVIKGTQPNWIIIENVEGFLRATPKRLKHIIGDYTIGEFVISELKKWGYEVNYGIVDGADYGTPQSRERLIILASKTEFGLWKFPKKDDFRKLLWEAIGDLPSIEAGETGKDKDGNPIRFHTAPELEQCQIDMLKRVPSGKSAHEIKGLDVVKPDGSITTNKKLGTYKRKDWGRPSGTLTQELHTLDGFATAHPGRQKTDGTYSDARLFTILELFRMTGLPDDYPIPENGEYDDRFIRGILGECMLPKLVERLITTLPRNKLK